MNLPVPPEAGCPSPNLQHQEVFEIPGRLPGPVTGIEKSLLISFFGNMVTRHLELVNPVGVR
jgi:hypothetical protein